jgi:hypothetical protein
VSLFFITLAAAAAAAAGLLAARRSSGALDREEADDAAPADEPAARAKKKSSIDAGLPLALGDVVSVDREERWLAGAIVARDADRLAAVVFLAPEGAKQHAIAVFPPPRREIFAMAPADVVCPGEPPTTLEIDTVAFTRKSRLPVALAREGQGVPQLAETGLLATYEAGARDVALVLSAGDRVFAFRGQRYDEDEYERLGGGS